jgi:peptidyl-prolyl cis-trans isomerase A (cyclophilin A)
MNRPLWSDRIALTTGALTRRSVLRRWGRRLARAVAIAAVGAGLQAQAADPATPAAAPTHPRVALETSLGRIVVELQPDRAPKSVENFLQYVKDGFYDGTVFHRVISTFMIQGGGFTPDMAQKATRAPIQNESRNGLKNVRGSVAMARTSIPDSATAQFFINVVDNGNLDYPSFDGVGYAVFGQVVEGMDVVEKIRAVPTTRKGMFENVPVNAVVIKTARLLK